MHIRMIKDNRIPFMVSFHQYSIYRINLIEVFVYSNKFIQISNIVYTCTLIKPDKFHPSGGKRAIMFSLVNVKLA